MRLALLAVFTCLTSIAVPATSASQPSALKVDTHLVADDIAWPGPHAVPSGRS